MSFARTPQAIGMAIALLASSATVHAQVCFRVTAIHPPDAKSGGFPPDVDNRGRIAGATLNHPGDASSFLRTRTGKFIELKPLPGAGATAMTAIGQNGMVVGGSGPTLFTARAAMWDAQGRVTEIGALKGDTFSLANDSSFAGMVLGASGSANGARTTAFVWHRGMIREVPIPGYPYASLEAFGSLGSMVGNAWKIHLNFDGQGFVIDRRGNVEMIGLLPGGTVSQLFDVNLFGTAVGLADDGSGPPKALLYRRGKLISLGALPGDFFAQLTAINNWGMAVGQSAGPTGPRAVLSHRGGELIDLNTRLDPKERGRWLVFSANGINDRGQIAAGVLDLSKTPPVGSAALLTPIWK